MRWYAVHAFSYVIGHVLQQLVLYETSAAELDIIRDISRTFPSHVFFQQRHGPGQRSLYNVLKAYSVYDRDVGYVQASLPVWLVHSRNFWSCLLFLPHRGEILLSNCMLCKLCFS